MSGQRQTSAPLYPRKKPGTHCTEGCVGPGPVWTGEENLAPTGIRFPEPPARSSVAIPTELPDPILFCSFYNYFRRPNLVLLGDFNAGVESYTVRSKLCMYCFAITNTLYDLKLINKVTR